MPTDHPQVRVKVAGFDEADVDEDLAPLVEALWRAGVRTRMSCQDNAPVGYVWLNFESAEDAQRFMTLAVPRYSAEDDSPYQRALADWDVENPWLFATSIYDLALEITYDEETNCAPETHPSGVPDWVFWPSIRFPRSDLASVTAAVRGAGAPPVEPGRG